MQFLKNIKKVKKKINYILCYDYGLTFDRTCIEFILNSRTKGHNLYIDDDE